MKGIPLLVFANKMDLDNALPVTDISQVKFFFFLFHSLRLVPL